MDAYEEFRNNQQLIAIGINCTSPFRIHNLLKTVKTLSKPLIVYSNDGSEWDLNKNWYLKIVFIFLLFSLRSSFSFCFKNKLRERYESRFK
jgi:hypothetical protein